VSLEAIARDAGVGIGRLYRHFPSREALTEAAYRAELAEVCASAAELLERCPPATALRRWMDRYAAFVAAKQGMAESLRAILASARSSPARPAQTSFERCNCCLTQAPPTAVCEATSSPTT
jgi:AcrR family transcriptional regulator